jgi:hypothetical protein
MDSGFVHAILILPTNRDLGRNGAIFMDGP